MLVIYSFFEILCNITEFFYLAITASRMNFFPSWSSNIVIFYYFAAFLSSHLILVLISFDRLLAICLPIL
uniref:G-protein coupled receptors family 1 profile domain-containing protein n=1 Tax=Meloidogyne enterolobii TaxID=390850 RepID=A0A6V7XV44_MELEN|nr:unnamed protein product [Meloidogyne enterolobii]